MAQQLYELDGWVETQIERYRKTPLKAMGRDFYQPPERAMQMQGLSSALRIMNLAYMRAREQGMPRQRLVWFEKFQNDALALIQEEQKRLAAMQQPVQQSPVPTQ